VCGGAADAVEPDTAASPDVQPTRVAHNKKSKQQQQEQQVLGCRQENEWCVSECGWCVVCGLECAGPRPSLLAAPSRPRSDRVKVR
jgi:hypothetical protein